MQGVKFSFYNGHWELVLREAFPETQNIKKPSPSFTLEIVYCTLEYSLRYFSQRHIYLEKKLSEYFF